VKTWQSRPNRPEDPDSLPAGACQSPALTRVLLPKHSSTDTLRHSAQQQRHYSGSRLACARIVLEKPPGAGPTSFSRPAKKNRDRFSPLRGIIASTYFPEDPLWYPAHLAGGRCPQNVLKSRWGKTRLRVCRGGITRGVLNEEGYRKPDLESVWPAAEDRCAPAVGTLGR
jgi:hypothetical protein